MDRKPEHILDRLYALLLERKSADPNSSYVAQLYKEGQDRILQKVGEEAIEVILAAKNKNREEIIQETADLWFHILVLLAEQELHPHFIFAELERRAVKPATTLPPTGADRREYSRRFYNRNVTLQFYSGLTIEGASKDVSLNGMLVECSFEPKWQLLGECGFFELKAGNHIHSFSFEVSRITNLCLGLTIVRDRGMFGFVLANEVFQDIFSSPESEEPDATPPPQ